MIEKLFHIDKSACSFLQS